MPGRRPARHDEVPEADAFDQARPAEAQADDDTDPAAEVRDLPREAAEADVLDQALPAEEPDDDWHDR
jgi:hypothetical protein